MLCGPKTPGFPRLPMAHVRALAGIGVDDRHSGSLIGRQIMLNYWMGAGSDIAGSRQRMINEGAQRKRGRRHRIERLRRNCRAIVLPDAKKKDPT